VTYKPKLGFDLGSAFARAVKNGDIEVAVLGHTKETTRYRLTEQGLRRAKDFLAEYSVGTGTLGGEAVWRFLHGMRPRPCPEAEEVVEWVEAYGLAMQRRKKRVAAALLRRIRTGVEQLEWALYVDPS
jgi:hypothetical protein